MKVKILYTITFLLFLFSSGNLYLYFLRSYNLNNIVLNQKTEKNQNAEIYKEEEKFICRENNVYKCYLEEYKRLLPNDTESEKTIYTLLSKKLSEGKLTSWECHEISHKIGKYSFLNNPRKNDLFGIKIRDHISDLNCATGFYHGILLGMYEKFGPKKSIEKFKEIENLIEEKIETQSGEEVIFSYEIIHGLGHVFFLESGDISLANKKCDGVVKNSKYLDICYSGVFMENSFLYQKINDNFDIEKCSIYDDKYVFGCLTGSRNSPEYTNNNKDKYIKDCYLYDEFDKKGCLNNFIIQEANVNNLPFKEVQNTCSKFATDDYQYCIHLYIAYQNNMQDKKLLCSLNTNIWNYFSCINYYNKYYTKYIFYRY